MDIKETESEATDDRLLISLKRLAWQLDADRSTVRRWLREFGLRPVIVGRGRNAAVRYRSSDIQAWLRKRQIGK